MSKTFLVSLLVVASFSITTYASDVENTYKEYEGILADLGIGKNYTKSSEENLVKYIKNLISETEKLSRDNQGKKESDKYKDQLDFYKYALKAVTKNNQSQNLLENENNYFTAKKILYNVKAPEFETRKRTMGDNLETILRRGVVIKTPYGPLGWDKSKKVIGTEKAELESHNLVSDSSDTFLTSEELAKMNPLEIANLDVRSDNSMWHTKKYLAANPNGWTDLEKWAEGQATKKLASKFETVLNGESFDYKLDEARNVVIFDEVKNSTSLEVLK